MESAKAKLTATKWHLQKNHSSSETIQIQESNTPLRPPALKLWDMFAQPPLQSYATNFKTHKQTTPVTNIETTNLNLHTFETNI
eukprot:4328869-Amphidinium_carterae.1